MMTNRCPVCGSANLNNAYSCIKCAADLPRLNPKASQPGRAHWLIKRAVTLVFVCLAVLAGFYLSLLVSAKRLPVSQRTQVSSAIAILDNKGFDREVTLLRYLTVYRAEDNWLNASVAKENAYAATNFPFELMTLYPDFFTYPTDDTERAAILLHEARHLQGDDEKEAYTFVWKNRRKFGWTKENYGMSEVWLNIRRQTRDNAPELFNCGPQGQADCTE